MMNNKVVFRLILLVALVAGAEYILDAQSAHQLRREGDRAYQRSEYSEAEQSYREAGEAEPNNPDVAYNRGNAIYQQGNYSESVRYFDQAAKATSSPGLQADALHNLGNAYMKQQQYQEAVNAYENSLRKRPGDPETKANLQLAKKKWQQEQERQQEQQNQQNQQQNEQDPQQQQNQQQQQDGQDQQPQQPENGEQQNQQPREEQRDGRMTPEQARRLLETAVGPEDKRNARKYREMEPGKHQVQSKKDW
ncbi:MAG: tetratricopeptide repeat protein [Bacteroidetes bacterium]|nr:MAG: tetratricopeptide repeat protein [Bacteroidota bacterium]